MAIQPVDVLNCLLLDLAEQGLPVEGEPELSATPRECASRSIVKSLLRKLDSGTTAETEARALAKFLACNQQCGEWVLPELTDDQSRILRYIREDIHEFWHKFDCRYGGYYPLVDHPYDVIDASRMVGPGAAIGARGGDFYTKLFDSQLTGTSQYLYTWYKRYTLKLPEWADAEIIRETHRGGYRVVRGNKITFVPKNDEISRTICVEPSLNMVYQLGFGEIITGRLFERYGISLESQQAVNRRLAHHASVHDDLATIDLSSASDTISLRMLQYVLPATFYRWLEVLRSPVAALSGEGTVALNMVSTMGNGFTFPLQTMLFSSVVVACLRSKGLPWNVGMSGKSWGVNGDDIIVPAVIADDVITTLALLGFATNNDKTFVKGPFRESCGGDFFLGVNVRGVYIKNLDDRAAIYSVINLLNRFSARTGIQLWRSVARLRKELPDPHLVPPWENMESGIHVPLSYARSNLTWSRAMYCYKYKAYVFKPRRIRVNEVALVVPRNHKARKYNPHGLLLSFLQGSVRRSQIGIRRGPGKWRTKGRYTSRWDAVHTLTDWSQDHDVDWRWWESTVLENLERGL